MLKVALSDHPMLHFVAFFGIVPSMTPEIYDKLRYNSRQTFRPVLDKAPKTAVAGDYDRRWISDDYFDLIVWYTQSDTIYGFQLCYDKPRWERALTWLSDRGFSHTAVDSGEDTPKANRSPVLVPDGSFPAEKVLNEFTRRAAALPVELQKLVSDKISQFAQRKV